MSFQGQRYDFRDKTGDYARVADELASLLAGESDLIANAANTAAMIFDALPDLNWAGFYFLHGDAQSGELVVGPFQGRPACVRIGLGKGVCGTAAVRRETLVVPDVQQFPGHIACDAASRSEIVVPLLRNGALLGVLDLDSPRLGRFDEDDRLGLERLARIFLAASAAPSAGAMLSSGATASRAGVAFSGEVASPAAAASPGQMPPGAAGGSPQRPR